MTFKEIRTLSGLTKAGFSRTYGIPLRTIEAWEADKDHGGRTPAGWILDLLARVVREDLEARIKSLEESG